jgi:hypothetical protein
MIVFCTVLFSVADPDPNPHVLVLLDPDPFVRVMDSDPAPDPSITKQKIRRKNLDSNCFVTFFYFLSLM